MKPDLTILDGNYLIFQADPGSPLPEWIEKYHFFSYTVTDEEVSVICKQPGSIPAGRYRLAGYRRIIRVTGPLDLSLTGIMADLSGILAQNSIPLFTISTFNTDYILIEEKYLEKAISALAENGYRVNQ